MKTNNYGDFTRLVDHFMAATTGEEVDQDTARFIMRELTAPGDQSRRHDLVRCLIGVRLPEVLELLAKLAVDDPDPMVRIYAVRGLARAETSQPVVLAATGEGDPAVRREAVLSLAAWPEDRAVWSTLLQLLQDRDTMIVATAHGLVTGIVGRAAAATRTAQVAARGPTPLQVLIQTAGGLWDTVTEHLSELRARGEERAQLQHAFRAFLLDIAWPGGLRSGKLSSDAKTPSSTDPGGSFTEFRAIYFPPPDYVGELTFRLKIARFGRVDTDPGYSTWCAEVTIPTALAQAGFAAVTAATQGGVTECHVDPIGSTTPTLTFRFPEVPGAFTLRPEDVVLYLEHPNPALS